MQEHGSHNADWCRNQPKVRRQLSRAEQHCRYHAERIDNRLARAWAERSLPQKNSDAAGNDHPCDEGQVPCRVVIREGEGEHRASDLPPWCGPATAAWKKPEVS